MKRKRIRCGATNTTNPRDQYRSVICRRPVLEEGQRCHSHWEKEFFDDEK